MTANRPESHLDEATLADLRVLLEDDFRDLIETFLEDAHQRHAELVALLAQPQADAPTLRSTAHSFKGSSLNVGATRLADLCRRLEDMAAAGVLSSADTLITDIGTELAATERLLRNQYLD